MAANDPVTITRSQIQYLAELILEAANAQTVERMVTVVNDSSDDYHVPTAKAVNSKVDGIQKYIVLTVASGNPSDVEDLEPAEDTMYMVRKNNNSEDFIPYIWMEDLGFITMPGTDVDESIGISAITDSEIANAVASAASSVVVIPQPSSGDDSGDENTGDDESGGENTGEDTGGNTDPTGDDNTDSPNTGDDNQEDPNTDDPTDPDNTDDPSNADQGGGTDEGD